MSKALSTWWDMDLRHDESLIVVSSNSLFSDPEVLTITTLMALSDMDIHLVATLVRNDRIPSSRNAWIAKFVPFDELLKYTTVLMTNGGYRSAQQVFLHGVPMVQAG